MFGVNRSAFAYWILGLCNNYGYVVMLSAAHDILAKQSEVAADDNSFNTGRHCNELSTGIILLADIIPCLIIKLIAPFLPLWMNVRMILIITAAALGFILVGLADSLTLAVIGVACTSFSGGLGESSLLSFTVFFNNKSIISAWSSGTGGAGFFGSITYAGLLAIGLKPEVTLFLLLIVPISMAISFWLILENPFKSGTTEQISISQVAIADIPRNISEQNFLYKVSRIPTALKYILPLLFVYYLEYLINQGLFELTLVENTFLKTSTQYRWYQVFYQIGVFISRSSISVIQINNLWLLAVLQAINLIFFTLEAIYRFTFSVLIIFIIILWEGVLGGLSYVNTFYKIQTEVSAEDKEIVTGITSISDSIGITLSGFTAIPLHNKICSLPTF